MKYRGEVAVNRVVMFTTELVEDDAAQAMRALSYYFWTRWPVVIGGPYPEELVMRVSPVVEATRARTWTGWLLSLRRRT